MNHAFEVIGRVTNDLSVRVDQALDFGTDYGMSSSLPEQERMLMNRQISIRTRRSSMLHTDSRKCSMAQTNRTFARITDEVSWAEFAE